MGQVHLPVDGPGLPPPGPGPSRVARYGLAVLLAVAAFALRLALAAYVGPPYLLFYPAVVLAALVGGLGPGLVATATSAVLAVGWLLPAERAPGPPTIREVVTLVVFVLVCTLLSVLASRHRASRRRVDQLEEERDAEARFRSMADDAPVLIWASGRDGRCTWFNQPWLAFTGRTMAQELGDGWAEGVHPDDLERCLATFRGALQRREPFTMEYRLRRHDGEHRWLAASGKPWVNGRGHFTGFIGSCFDVTALKQAQEALERNQQRLDLALRSGKVGLWDLDLATDRAWRTLQHDRIFGYEALQPDWGVEVALRHVLPEDRPIFRHALQEALATGHFHYELRIQPQGQPLRWIAAEGEVSRDPAGRPVRMVGTVVDVTERKRSEAALQQSRNLLALFVEHAPAAIAMMDRDLRYLAVSRRYLLDYGLGQQEVIGRGHYELFPELPERWKEVHRRCLAGAVEKCDADPFPRADGRTDWVRWEIRPWYAAPGEVGGILLFSEVVTERVELERRTARAERVAALGIMAAGMSHEINNPLTYVVSGVAFAREQVEGLPEACRAAWPAGQGTGREEVRAALDEAAEGAQRVRDLVADLRAFATGQHTADARCDLPGALARASRVARHAFTEGTRLTLDLPPLPAVAGSEAELAQLFGCLLVNAAQARSTGPDDVRVTAALAGRVVVVRVSDTGRGIPATDLPRIFEPFFTTKAIGQGKGLGLPVALGIAQGLGGTIEVQSVEGMGTTCSVSLPVAGGA